MSGCVENFMKPKGFFSKEVKISLRISKTLNSNRLFRLVYRYFQDFVKEKPRGMKFNSNKREIQTRVDSNKWYAKPKIRHSLEISKKKNKKVFELR